jgi:hypothetical protein
VAIILACRPYFDVIPVIYNVEGVVGAMPAVNKPDDVALVKAFLRKMGDVPGTRISATTAAACKAIQVNSTADEALITAIRAYQTDLKKKDPHIVVDGRVSPANESFMYHATGSPWTIVQLNGDMKSKTRFGSVWPCVHLAKDCDPTLRVIAKKAIFGSDF